MTALGSVSFDRSALSLSPLVADTEGFGTYYIAQGGLGRVGKTPRETIATASPFVHGQLRTAVVLDESSLALTLRVQSDSWVDLDAAVTALEDALLTQFTYPLTVVVSGVTKVWDAYPATMNSTDALVDVQRVRNYFEDLAITIPVYPISS